MGAKQYAPWLLLGTGFSVFLVGDLLDVAGELKLAMVLASAALMFAGVVALDLLAHHRCVDEEAMYAEHRAGHFAFVVLGGLLVTGLVVATATGVEVGTETLLLSATAVGLGTFLASRLYLGRRA